MKKQMLLLASLMLFPLVNGCNQNNSTDKNSSSTNVVSSSNKESTTSSTSVVSSSSSSSSSSIIKIDPIDDYDFLSAGYIYGKPKMMKDKGIGEPVSLRGTNIGSLFVQENWMTLTDASCQLDAMVTLTERFGKEQMYELFSIYEDNFWTEEDWDNCVELGINCIRLPITYMNVWDFDHKVMAKKDLTATEFKNLTFTVREDSMAKIDKFIADAGERGIYIILDLHGAPGSQNGQDHSGDTSRGDRLWYYGDLGDALREKTIELWELLAARYKDNPIIAAYDILNEPAGSVTGNVTTNWEFELFDRLYKAIRAIDPDHTIVMESCWDVANLPRPESRDWENVMYQYHQYTWSDYNSVEVQFGEMKGKIDRIVAADLNIPILMGEFTMHTNITSWRKCLAYLNEFDIHWTTWSYKVKDNSTWGLFNMYNAHNVKIKTDSIAAIKTKWTDQRTNIQKNNTVYPAVAEFIGGKTIAD